MKFKKLLLVILILVIVVLIINSFLTKVDVVKDDSLNWIKEKRIAHRGIYNNEDIVENSLSAIKLTIEKDENLEIDVQRTKDDVVVVFHDFNLKRLTGVDKNLEDLTYEEIREITLLKTDDYIPTLKEVLEIVDGKVGLLIEIKNEGSVGRLEELVAEDLKNYKGDFAIQAFNPFVLEWFSLNAPHIKRGQLAGGFEESELKEYEKFLLSNFLLNFKAKPNFIAYKADELPKRVVERMRNKGMIVLAWDIVLGAEEEISFDLYDNIIYERKK